MSDEQDFHQTDGHQNLIDQAVKDNMHNDDEHSSSSSSHQQQHSSNGGADSSDNGYIVVQEQAARQAQHDEVSRMIAEFTSNNSDNKETKVIAEADSSTTPAPSAPPCPASSSSSCTLCPYYKLGIKYVNSIEVPPKVRDMLLWKDPKCSGAVFGTSLVLLLSIACCSLLSVVGSLMLLALSAVGAYRFYLALLFRIKGQYDDTFSKLSSKDFSLPKEKVKELTNLLENDINKLLNNLKAIILWDNVTTSTMAFACFYVLYCVGTVFNTMTLLILALISAFTIPKVYQVYKKPIDQALENGTTFMHQTIKQVMSKMPPFVKNMLSKSKKTQ